MIESRRIRILMLPVAMMLILFLSACTTTKPFVGRRVSYRNPFFCTCYNLPKACTTKTRHFIFDFKISEADISGEYVIKGGTTWSRTTMRALDTAKSRFFLLLVSEGVITDNISIFPVGTDLGLRLPFKKAFKSLPFDAAGIGYQTTTID